MGTRPVSWPEKSKYLVHVGDDGRGTHSRSAV